MSRKIAVSLILLSFFFVQYAHALSVGSDGGITVSLSYSGDLDHDLVTDNDGNPITDSSGHQWLAKDKLEHDLELFARHVFEMSEEKHYIRQVLISNEQRAWANADIRWDMGPGSSSAALNGWSNSSAHLNIRRGWRTTIHDVSSHEFGHYFYGLSDEYAKNYGYYYGHFPGSDVHFGVKVTIADPITVMNANTPHQFCDTTDHSITIEYTNPSTSTLVTQSLTTAVIDDGNPNNDGPLNDWINQLFAIDGWSVACINQTDLIGHHTEGVRPVIDFSAMPELQLHYVEQDGIAPGRILLLDRSGSMGHEEYGIKASQYVQEAGLFLYHSSEETDYIGAFTYNDHVDKLFDYDQYNSASTLASFLDPTGLTDISLALETALDSFIDVHGEAHVAGAEIFLMSDGKQTTGADLWIQVDRARDLGVNIHTFSYGDADETTMQQIATETSGDNLIMSENDSDLMNLKMGMVKSMARKQGWTSVYNYYGTLEWKAISDLIMYSTLNFKVPDNSKDVKFYLFPEGASIASYSFSMANPSATSTFTSSLDNTQQKGRFLGKKVKGPDSGTWSVNILGNRRPATFASVALPDTQSLTQAKVHLLAFIDNKDIDARVWVDDSLIAISQGYPKVPVYASISNKYLLTKAGVVSRIYAPDGTLVAGVEMSDNGKNGDRIAEDGIYTGLLDAALLAPKPSFAAITYVPRIVTRFNIKAYFTVTESSVPAPSAEYEYGTDYKSILKSFRPSTFEAYAETGVGLTQNQNKPYLETKGFEKIRLERGKIYQEWISIANATPGTESIRVNLGQGVIVRKIESSRERAGNYLIEFEVAQDASPGKKDLFIQFGNEVLTKTGYGEIAASAETCDGRDNDGDGLVDENLTRSCSTDCGTGRETCQRGQWVGCTAPAPAAEVCDGRDNDCDGKIDEDLTQPCPNGGGVLTCQNGQWAGCFGPQECKEDDSGKLDIVGVEGKTGDEIKIPVRIQSAPAQVEAFGFELTYDADVLEYTGFERGSLVQAFPMFDVNTVGPARLVVGGLTISDGIPKGASGYLVWLKFKVIAGQENSQEKECFPLEIVDTTDDVVNFSATGGCFCLSTCNGDLNQDGKITPSDALIAFKCYLGSGTCPACADVNQDGKVSPADALCLFKKYLGQASCLD
ncbi:MAG: VWA domain-containing protein [bacterium]